MFRHTDYLQFDAAPEKPDPVCAPATATTNAAAEPQGRVQPVRLHDMTDDPACAPC